MGGVTDEDSAIAVPAGKGRQIGQRQVGAGACRGRGENGGDRLVPALEGRLQIGAATITRKDREPVDPFFAQRDEAKSFAGAESLGSAAKIEVRHVGDPPPGALIRRARGLTRSDELAHRRADAVGAEHKVGRDSLPTGVERALFATNLGTELNRHLDTLVQRVEELTAVDA